MWGRFKITCELLYVASAYDDGGGEFLNNSGAIVSYAVERDNLLAVTDLGEFF